MPNPGFIRGTPNPRGQLAGTLGAALGQGLGELTGQYYADKSLNAAMDSDEYKQGDLAQKLQLIAGATSKHGARGHRAFAQQVQIAQQAEIERQHKAKEEIERTKALRAEKGKQSLIQALKNSNVPEEEISVFSELYDAAPEGGRTEIIKGVNDLIRRGKLGDFQKKAESDSTPEENAYYNFPQLKEEAGLSPAEKIRREDHREKYNLPLYEDVNKKLKSYEEESRSLERLEQLNPKMESGLGKWNINPTSGELIFPAASSPETQLFAKTINDFTTKAKDTFPGRVTNFDLQAFMKRLPGLSNSKEGRDLIIKQMQLSNRIANLREEALKEVYDHYGTMNISASEAKKIADKIYKEKKPELEERLKSLDGLLDEKAQQNKGSKVKLYDPRGNPLFVSPEDVEEAKRLGARDELPR